MHKNTSVFIISLSFLVVNYFINMIFIFLRRFFTKIATRPSKSANYEAKSIAAATKKKIPEPSGSG